jgi:DNA-binding transcriptional LysR family regulator
MAYSFTGADDADEGRVQRTPLIDLFHKRNPGLRVELIISDREFDLPKEADIAIRGGEPQDDTLVGRKIAEAPWAVYASRAYVERHGRPECPADIERHLVIDCVAKHPGAQWLRSVAPRATIVSRADNHPGLILAVRSGAGLAALALPVKEPNGLAFASKAKGQYLGREVDVMHACGTTRMPLSSWRRPKC